MASGQFPRMALCAVIALSIAGCKQSDDAPSVSLPSTATRPAHSTTQVANADVPPSSNLHPIPELGTSSALKMRDGEIWQKYPSGLLIYEVRPGSGRLPRVGETVHVAYVGTFAGSDKEFDRATKENPFSFQLGSKNIIEGWNLGVSTMGIGGKRRIWLPPDLAYGMRGSLPRIPPNTPLVFEIELLNITGEPVDFPATKVPLAKPIGPEAPTSQPAK